MKLRRHNVSEDRQTILRRHSRLNAEENSLQIPIDLIIEIFLRLPVESIAKCRCISKLWANLLVRPDFTDSFLTRSLARPQLLFACHNRSKCYNRSKDGVFYFSAPQSQNPDESSSTIAASYHMKFSFDYITPMCRPVSGFVCIRDKRRKSLEQKFVLVICNPSTGQSFTLPKMKTRKMTCMSSFLGYDPIGKQHKVLAMTNTPYEGTAEHQVLTLGGNGKLTWRMIECGIPHDSPGTNAICINGVLYFKAKANRFSIGHEMIVYFDVRSEKYSFVKVIEILVHPLATLLNYNGKLAVVLPISRSRSFKMWVLQDSEKHEWSKHVYKLPPLWKYIDAVWDHFYLDNLYFVGVTDTNEIVFCLKYLSRGSFYVYYYNLERETIRHVEIQGLEAFKRGYIIETFANHVEDVKLMKLF